jgi:hypothetical protein
VDQFWNGVKPVRPVNVGRPSKFPNIGGFAPFNWRGFCIGP